MKRIDLHCDTLIRVAQKDFKGDLANNELQIDLNRLKESDALIQFFAIFLSQKFDPDMEKVYGEFQRVIGYLKTQEEKYPELFSVIHDKKDLSDLGDKVGVVITIEDGAMINGKSDRVKELYDQGVRLITLTWNFENTLGYPNSPDPTLMSKGLKPFGIEVIKKMNELGMIVDVSHLSDGGFWDVMKYSTKPVMASHSNSRILTNHPRNMTDDMIKALSDNGGVMGLNFCPSFCGNDPEYTSVSDLVKHALHIKEVGGIEVLALGSDYDGIHGVQEMKDCTEYDKLAKGLSQAGFTDEEIEMVFYKNALRVINANLK